MSKKLFPLISLVLLLGVGLTIAIALPLDSVLWLKLDETQTPNGNIVLEDSSGEGSYCRVKTVFDETPTVVQWADSACPEDQDGLCCRKDTLEKPRSFSAGQVRFAGF